MRHSVKGFWCVNEYFFILYCVVESGATWLEIACPGAWPSWVLYHTVCLLSCHRRSKSLLALYHFHQHVYSNRCFIWLSNSLTMARNSLTFSKSKFSSWIVFSLGTNKKDVLTPSLCYTSSHCPGHLIPITSITSSQTTSVLFHRNTIQNFIDYSLWGVIP